MYSASQLAFKYLRYYLAAANGRGHGIHSPFVFDFITKILNDKKIYDAYHRVEKLRWQLKRDQEMLIIEDLGAGSSSTKTGQRTVASLAKHAAKPRKLGQLLYRMVKYYRPMKILELGTSLGISSSYLALANPAARLVTIEGAAAVAAKAKTSFENLGLANIELVRGSFDDTLPLVLKGLGAVDFVFIDGNHRYEPTLRYFEELLPYTHDQSILVFDDIHWSGEMELAWQDIKKNPSVRCSVDLFFIGIVFFRKEFLEKQDFIIRY
ncbi:MAG TPA: class I SAM-dependent methyltransferase [Chitinophagaceae bacterium]|nr:class I SAM-dependent methyltransferase [Chitinophagaceae bacterium]